MYSIYDDIKYILYWYINSIFTCYLFPPFLIEPTEGLRLVIREFPPKVVSNFINGKNIKDRNIRRISSGIKTGAPHAIALRCAPFRHFYGFSLVPAGIIADFGFSPLLGSSSAAWGPCRRRLPAQLTPPLSIPLLLPQLAALFSENCRRVTNDFTLDLLNSIVFICWFLAPNPIFVHKDSVGFCFSGRGIGDKL